MDNALIVLWILSLLGLLLSLGTAAMFLNNLPLFCDWSPGLSTPSPDSSGGVDAKHSNVAIAVLIPARDEEASIEACVRHALSSERVDVEIIVLDDHSTDATKQIVLSIADEAMVGDNRLRCETAPELPPDWNGKQHACFHLSKLSDCPLLVFLDADVRLSPNALADLVAYRNSHAVDLLSAFPNQTTGTWLEKMIIPIMHYVLLCFLPMSRMRKDRSPSLAAGCGQLFMTTSHAYQKAGTHRAIASSRHDGVKLPRVYRNRGLSTDVVDGSDLAKCRMYTNANEVIRGVLKNATEGIGGIKTIVPFTAMLLGSSLLPVLTLVGGIATRSVAIAIISAIAIVVSHLPRWMAARRLNQSFFGAAMHVPAMILFVGLQWIALIQSLFGYQVRWRGRTELS